MELIERSETSANHNRTPGRYPKEYIKEYLLFGQIILAQSRPTVHVEYCKRISTVSAEWCSRKVLFARSSVRAAYFSHRYVDIQHTFSLAATAATVAAVRLSPFRISHKRFHFTQNFLSQARLQESVR